MPIIIALIIGIVIGVVLTVIISQVRSVGLLQIDSSNTDDSPYLFLELSKDLDVVYRKKYAMLKVNIKEFVPHK